MCGKGEVNYTQKYLCGCTVIMLVIIVILSMVINFGGKSGGSVEMSGENESALVEESLGIHLLEINGSGMSSNGGNEWNWMEILCVVLGFIFVLNFTHICHYCFFTKKVVKRKVARDVQMEMGRLAKAPQAIEGGGSHSARVGIICFAYIMCLVCYKSHN